jgi:hypothetical protein
MFLPIILIAFLSNVDVQAEGYKPPPAPTIRQRYVGITGQDTLSFLLYRNSDSAISIENENIILRSPYPYEIDSYHAHILYKTAQVFFIAHTVWNKGFGHYDTIFRGTFESNYHSLHGLITIPGDSSREVIFSRDSSYIDTETLLQDSLLQAFQLTLYHGDRKAIANYMEFPLVVGFIHPWIDRHHNYIRKYKSLHIKNKKQFFKYYKKIFNAAEVKRLLNLPGSFWEFEEHWRVGMGDLWIADGWQSSPPTLSITSILEHY